MQSVARAGLVSSSASTLPPFALLRPAQLDEAVAALREADRPVLLAGGTDLVAAFNEGLMPGTLIDLSRIDALRRIELADEGLRIGATVTHAVGCEHALLTRHAPGLAAAWRRIANPRVRLAGTLGGNLMARRQRYEGSVLLSAIGASLDFAGPAGPSRIAPAALWAAPPAQSLLQTIVVPLAGLQWFGYERSMRPLITLASALRLAADGLILRCAVATEYLAPVLLERALPTRHLADVAALARSEAIALMAGLPDDFNDPVVNARYARSAGAALLARQLEGAHRG